MSLEFFVIATSLTLGGLLVLLTVITQLQVHATAGLRAPWTYLRAAVYSSLRGRGRGGTECATRTADGRPRGKKAKRTERRRQRRALVKSGNLDHQQRNHQSGEHHTRSTPVGEYGNYTLYGQQWYQQEEEERRVLRAKQNTVIHPHSMHLPCSGCRIVSAKKNCSYNCCARCCRTQTRSVCRAHGTGYQAAVESVEGAVQYRYFEFDLSYGHLKVCPPRVTAIGKQLVSLNLSNNRLSSVPEDIGLLSSLKELFLQYNSLTQLPDGVCELRQLVELDVKNNRLAELPSKIGRLRQLVILNITNNCVAQLPPSLGSLTKLEELGLHSNQLTELPEEVCNLTSLRVVYSGENRFRTLPSRFGQLWQLQELDVSGCELETLPQSLSHCVSIIRLWLSNNRLTTLPVHMGNLQQLKELHVRNNRLKYLPASIEQLHLYTFTAQNNSFVDERTAQEMCHTPTDSVPPLMELSGRAVLNHGIAWDSVPLPICLREMLSRPMRCSLCGGPFFHFFSSLVTFKTVGVFYRVPLSLYLCSPHLQHTCTVSHALL